MEVDASSEIVFADYHNPAHASAIIELMNIYATDPMGGGEPLSDFVKGNLVNELDKIEGAFTILSFIKEQTVGLINCMPGFSTFNCKPLINIHDVIVIQEFRGQNITAQMLAVAEQRANKLGCCKMTLEVLEGNGSARRAYHKFGFRGYELDPAMGKALFLDKIVSG